ncbi:DUF58 domain-containing protein [Paenibacillus illinoisensis]|uniref:Uncharacterized protein n=1 Tax=Paenibacillus illinoisensis TaxID=59845 RepID=A0A2W0CEQ7_9BACL|nr:DUF58 domain-containing protein [Paenibacillus illinoisensis]PYY31463.1 Uncharacterized protein PIL02S_00104 [Paenibacillus illinoisensis]
MTAPVQWLFHAVLAAAFACLYLWHGGKAALFLSITVSLILISGLVIHLLGPRRIRIRRQMNSERIMVGEMVRVQVEVEFECRIPLLWIMLCEDTPAGVHRKLLFPGMRRKFAYQYQMSGLRRGLYQWGSGQLYWGDVFGWNTVSAETVGGTSLAVVPSGSTFGDRESAAFAAVDEGTSANTKTGHGNRSPEFREYQPGDPLGRIHWKSTAKTGKLQTFLPEISESTSLGILLYEGKTGYERRIQGAKEHPGFERAINMAARWVFTAVRDDVPYQLWRTGVEAGPDKQPGWLSDLIHAEHVNLSLDSLAQASISSADLSVSLLADTTILDQCPAGTRMVVLTGRLDPVLTGWVLGAAELGHEIEVQLTETQMGEEQAKGNRVQGGLENPAEQWTEQLRLSGVRVSSVADQSMPFIGKAGVSDVGA